MTSHAGDLEVHLFALALQHVTFEVKGMSLFGMPKMKLIFGHGSNIAKYPRRQP